VRDRPQASRSPPRGDERGNRHAVVDSGLLALQPSATARRVDDRGRCPPVDERTPREVLARAALGDHAVRGCRRASARGGAARADSRLRAKVDRDVFRPASSSATCFAFGPRVCVSESSAVGLPTPARSARVLSKAPLPKRKRASALASAFKRVGTRTAKVVRPRALQGSCASRSRRGAGASRRLLPERKRRREAVNHLGSSRRTTRQLTGIDALLSGQSSRARARGLSRARARTPVQLDCRPGVRCQEHGVQLRATTLAATRTTSSGVGSPSRSGEAHRRPALAPDGSVSAVRARSSRLRAHECARPPVELSGESLPVGERIRVAVAARASRSCLS